MIDAPYLTGRDTDGSGQLLANRTTVDSGVTGDGGVMGLMLFVPGWVNSSFIAKYLTILELW